jgi:hypothetical protein
MNRKLRNVAKQPISGRGEQSMGKGGWCRTRPPASSMSVRRSRLDLASPSSCILQPSPPSSSRFTQDYCRRLCVSLFAVLVKPYISSSYAKMKFSEHSGPPSASREPPSVHSRECLTILLESSHSESTSCRPGASRSKAKFVTKFCGRRILDNQNGLLPGQDWLDPWVSNHTKIMQR